MQNIGFTTSTYRTTSTPEKLGATIEKMAHDLPTIWSWVSNGFLTSIVITNKFLLSGHIHVYHWDIYVKGQLMRLTLYNQNPRFWKCLIQPTISLNIEMVFGTTYPFMNIKHMLLQKIIQILLGTILPLNLIQ